MVTQKTQGEGSKNKQRTSNSFKTRTMTVTEKKKKISDEEAAGAASLTSEKTSTDLEEALDATTSTCLATESVLPILLSFAISTILETKRRKTSKKQDQDDEIEEEEEEAPEVTTYDVLEQWAGTTSIHGVAFATDKHNKDWFRRLWAFLVLFMIALLLWQVENIFEQYMEYDTTITTKTVIPQALEFPQVTLCNLNPYSYTKQQQTQIWEPANDDELNQILRPVGQDSFDIIKGKEDLEIGFIFNNKPLDPTASQIKPVITDFGRCYQFTTTEKVVQPGFSGGLGFAAWLNQTHDQAPMQKYAGIMIFVQQPGSSVLHVYHPDSILQPGSQSNLVQISSLEWVRETHSSWSKCYGTAPSYTQSKCREGCKAQAMIERCNCRYLRDQRTDASSTKYCQPGTGPQDEIDCYKKFITEESDILQNCEHDCSLPPCSEILYKSKVVDVGYSQPYLKGVLEDQVLKSYNMTIEDYQNNYVSATINFDGIAFQRIVETKAMTNVDLLSAIGGSMGLFLGISTLSVLEVVGDLFALRLLPRFLCGYKSNLYGLGGKKDD